MANFPNGVGGDKPQQDERTIYAPVDGQDYAYPEGFPTLKKTDLVDKNGEVIKSISAGTTVWFTAPATLHKRGISGIPGGKVSSTSWFAKVSLKGHDKPFDGYVSISKIKKPGGKSQKRVAAGTKTQQECAAYIKELCDKKGIEYWNEAFIDRAYQDNGQLLTRSEPNSVLNDSKLIYRRIKNLTQNKGVYSINGNWIPLDAKTLCVHGDHPNAASLLKSVLSYLEINET